MNKKTVHWLLVNFILSLPITAAAAYIGNSLDFMYQCLGLFVVLTFLYWAFGVSYFEVSWLQTINRIVFWLMWGLGVLTFYAFVAGAFLLMFGCLGLLTVTFLMYWLYRLQPLEKENSL